MKPKCPTRSTLALCVLGALSGGFSNQADAFQLGQLQGASRIGEPLNAYINVLLGPTDASKVTDVLVIPDFSYRNDPSMNAALDSIKAELVRNEYGNHYIKLTSTEKLNLPVLAFRIKATNGSNTLIRSFSVAPGPAIPAIVQQPRAIGRSRDITATTTRRKSPQVAGPVSAANEPQTALSGNQYGPVKAGDTLWKIATQVAGANAGSVLNELFELNPHAFINGDINKLKQGVTLNLPARGAVVANALDPVVEPSAATATVAEPAAEIATENSTAPGTTEMDPALVFEDPTFESQTQSNAESAFADLDEQTLPTSQTPAVENIELNTLSSVGTATNKLPTDWRTDNPDLAEKLDNLSAKYAALRAKYAEQQQASETIAPGLLAQSAEQSLVEPPATGTGSSETGANLDTAKSTLVTAESEVAELAPIEESSIESVALAPEVPITSRFQLPLWAIGLVGLAIILGAGGYYANRLRRAAEAKRNERQRKQQDSSLKEQLAKKAQHRVTMEDEVERMLKDQVEDTTSESEKTLKLNVEELMVEPEDALELDLAEDDSPENKINDSIAHGRYSEAEDLLREVIDSSPRNFSAKLRLAEVYYITERIDDFVDVSQDIHANHRPDISDDDWRRVMRMGKMIAPEQPPFSGPQSIMGDASAG